MAIVTGKDGTLILGTTEVASLTDWSLEISCATKSYTANDTGAWPRHVAGAKRARGSFRLAVADHASIPVVPGQAVILKLHLDRSGNHYYRLVALIESIRSLVNVSQGETVPCEITFVGDGPVSAFGVFNPESLEVIPQM